MEWAWETLLDWRVVIGVVLVAYVLDWVRFSVTKPKFPHQTVWITGASSGIGEHLSIAFAKSGASLILSSRNTSELDRVKSICQQFTSDVTVVPLDLSHAQDALYVSKQLSSRYQIDILVNNAGVSQRTPISTSLNTMRLEEKLFALNYFGAIAVTKGVLESMIRRRSGQIVLISSVAGLLEAPLRSIYGASKAAISAYMESLRAEVDRHNVKVTTIFPGFVQSNIASNALGPEGVNLKCSDSNNSQGMDTQEFVEEALKHIYYQHPEVIIAQPTTKLFVWLQKHITFLFDLISPWRFRSMEQAFTAENSRTFK